MTTVPIATEHRHQLLNITAKVQDAVTAAQCREGICHVNTAHTTAGLTINENADPDVVHDILHSLDTIVRDLSGFRHAEGNSAAHVKSSLMGAHVCVPVHEGRLVLGTWQAIYFCEFDGPRQRKVWVTCTKEG
jgi:secondary thiamine-phosphate synthase enzyme